ncbi:hypothetical protein V1477_019412 [Vespula maculifrons]|uniref:Uncharacterized protein n=1 Tax=Vespula maculifrons TaxID=7453 RepID=A0ABD2AT49_VESMC
MMVSCTLDIYEYFVELHIVSNSFSISRSGVLEADLKNLAKINFMEKNVSWKRILISFVGSKQVTFPKLNLGDDIYTDEAIVTNSNEQRLDWRNLKQLTDSTDSFKRCGGDLSHIDTPELSFLGQDKRASESILDHHSVIGKTRGDPNSSKIANSISPPFVINRLCKMITKTSESRYEQILQYEKLDALNDEEKEVAKIIIKNLIDLFHLSDVRHLCRVHASSTSAQQLRCSQPRLGIFVAKKVDSILGPHQLILITEIEVNRNFPYEGFPSEDKGTPQKEFIFPEAHAS